MDPAFRLPASPGTPLLQSSPDRVNHQRQSFYDQSPSGSIHGRHSRENSVHDKVAAFNSMAFQTKQGERKIADAALKRAMLGREEAEEKMRQFKRDAENLARKVEEGRERERKVGQRLETIMENYGRAKETHEHTKITWEKEIRRARKENFKSQSMIVKLQEELKSSRETTRRYHVSLEQEKERSTKREQEAFAARYQLVSVQEELEQMQEKIKLVEQERDALRTIAKNEEIARIAAEGRLPLPPSPENDEFASPKKARKSLDPVMITSSAAGEEELDDMRMLLEWERQRADRAHDRVEFLEAECRFNCCASRSSDTKSAACEEEPKSRSARSNPVFIPSEGVFRTVSPLPEESSWISPAKKNLLPNSLPQDDQATPIIAQQEPITAPDNHSSYARTPSCEPPAAAIIQETNTSLMSLLDAPQSPAQRNNSNEVEAEDETPTPTQARVYQDSNPSPAPEYTFHTISTTTKVPLANPPDLNPPNFPPLSENSALSPTMTREEALAQIRERRGRARSLAQGTLTPRKQMVEGADRRDISAPAIRSGNVRGRLASRV